MSEKERAILDRFEKELPNLNSEQLSYVLGLGDGMALIKTAGQTPQDCQEEAANEQHTK